MIKKEDFINELKHLWANLNFDTSTIIDYLEKEGIEFKEEPLIERIKEIKLEKLYTYELFCIEDNECHSRNIGEINVYESKNVDKKIALQEELINKLKSCRNCVSLVDNVCRRINNFNNCVTENDHIFWQFNEA